MTKLFSKQYDETFHDIESCSWLDFRYWLSQQNEYQFDIETTVSPYWMCREIVTMQFGDMNGQLQYVLDYQDLTEEQMSFIRESLEDWKVVKNIHNAAFEYIVCRFHDIEIHNMFCTMLAEKVINGGIENADYALSDLTESYCNIVLDKSYQTSFGDRILTPAKVHYAADDVKYLSPIKKNQMKELQKWELLHVIDLENKVCPAFGDMTYYGLKMNKEKWNENIAIAEPVIRAAKDRLAEWVKNDEKLRKKAIELGILKLEDEVNFNLNSPKVKAELLKLEFPDIEGGSKIMIQKYIRDNRLSTEHLNALLLVIDKDYSAFTQLLLEKHRDKLIEFEMVHPAGDVVINWNSVPQVLPLLKAVEPKLKDLSAESFGKTTHPVIADLEEYKDTLKLLSSYGEKFFDLLEPDGYVRPSYNQIVSTGRSSCSKPNMQQVPAKEAPDHILNPWLQKNPDKKPSDFNNRYRNAFVYKEGFKFVDSDFTGQELALIAHVAKDEVWYTAITNGEDLHSVTAEMVFKDKWKNATEPGCAYYASRQKCKCRGHKSMRNGIKTINFG